MPSFAIHKQVLYQGDTLYVGLGGAAGDYTNLRIATPVSLGSQFSSQSLVMGHYAKGSTTASQILCLSNTPTNGGFRAIVMSIGSSGGTRLYGDFVTYTEGAVIALPANATFVVHNRRRVGILIPDSAIPDAMLEIECIVNSEPAMHLKAASGQLAHIQNWTDINDVVLCSVSENGYFKTKKTAAPADAEIDNNELTFWWDQANSKLMLKAKDAGSVVKTGAIALPLAASISISIDGAGSAITTGLKNYVYVPHNMVITGWTLLADQVGSIVIDAWKDTYANYPPLVGDTIFGTKPALAAAQKNTASGLSIAVTAGDIVALTVDSAATLTKVHFAFTGYRT